ncbi:MAG: hypothetical protein JWL95_1646 [Gemmatimonadetes bacterium]|nr:hypothetical protein [Gemmatimonadota bacterium]
MPPKSRPSSTGVSALVQRLFVAATSDAGDDAALAEETERVCANVGAGLSRWFGPYGSLALVTRALSGVQAAHTSLAEVTVTTSALTQGPTLTGLTESARVHGTAATTEGVLAVLTALINLIGRLIGDDLASRLFELSITGGRTASPNGTTPATGAAQPNVTER